MILYVYAIGRAGHPLPDDAEAVDGGGLTAFFAPVDEVEFSQPVIDARSKDVEWLGRIGYRHQFEKILERVDGKQEWTLRIELDPERWRDALSKRVESLAVLEAEMAAAAPGKAFL